MLTVTPQAFENVSTVNLLIPIRSLLSLFLCSQPYLLLPLKYGAACMRSSSGGETRLYRKARTGIFSLLGNYVASCNSPVCKHKAFEYFPDCSDEMPKSTHSNWYGGRWEIESVTPPQVSRLSFSVEECSFCWLIRMISLHVGGAPTPACVLSFIQSTFKDAKFVNSYGATG